MTTEDREGFWEFGVRQKCMCGGWLPEDGNLHPRCRTILKDGLRKVYFDTMKSIPPGWPPKTS